MIVLGFNGGMKFEHEDMADYRAHDAAAVVMRDGEVLAAVEEERLTRLKHANSFPANAIRWCLESAGVQWRDVDVIATNMSRARGDLFAMGEFWNDAERKPLGDATTRLNSLFERAFGVDVRERLRFCHHHVAHAWSAFIPSGFDRSLIVSLDGAGEEVSGMVLVGGDGTITTLREYGLPQSLGHLYVELIRLLGYSRFDEYKVMGLAPYGDPGVYGPLLETVYELLPEGHYRLASRRELLARLHAAGLLAQARRKGEPFGRMHIDFAAAVQAALERIVFHVIAHFAAATGERNLCLAGGVAHNCTLNGKLSYSELFEGLFVQPAAHDAGGALGAAWWACHEPRRPARRAFRHLYFGMDIGGADAVRTELQQWRGLLDVEHLDGGAAPRVAELLANGAVVSWAQGRAEFGPRALGNRSILADPRPEANKRIINDLVKKRESYRPFAPSVLIERAADYFEVPKNQRELPFMIFVVNVRNEWRERLGAITHVDGTARVQTVSRDVNPRFWALIREFEQRTGVAMLLNTSFNNFAEPIVGTVRDAIVCFLTTALEYLVVGDFLVTKRPHGERSVAYERLAPDLPPHRKLVRRKRFNGDGYCCRIESAKSREFGPTEVLISDHLFDVLRETDGLTPLSVLLRQAGLCEPTGATHVIEECLDLWSRRILVLRPSAEARGARAGAL
jgi:carbamoyltransferase